jgi:hypothetical protein
VTATVQCAEVVLPSLDEFRRLADLTAGDELFTAAVYPTTVIVAENLSRLPALSITFCDRATAGFGGHQEVISATPAGEMQCRAITVADLSGVYVTGGDFVLTRGGRCS